MGVPSAMNIRTPRTGNGKASSSTATLLRRPLPDFGVFTIFLFIVILGLSCVSKTRSHRQPLVPNQSTNLLNLANPRYIVLSFPTLLCLDDLRGESLMVIANFWTPPSEEFVTDHLEITDIVNDFINLAVRWLG